MLTRVLLFATLIASGHSFSFNQKISNQYVQKRPYSAFRKFPDEHRPASFWFRGFGSRYGRLLGRHDSSQALRVNMNEDFSTKNKWEGRKKQKPLQQRRGARELTKKEIKAKDQADALARPRVQRRFSPADRVPLSSLTAGQKLTGRIISVEKYGEFFSRRRDYDEFVFSFFSLLFMNECSPICSSSRNLRSCSL